MFILVYVGPSDEAEELQIARRATLPVERKEKPSPSRPQDLLPDFYVDRAVSGMSPEEGKASPEAERRNKYLFSFDPSLRLTNEQKTNMCDLVSGNPYLAGRRIRFRAGRCSQENQDSIAATFLRQMELSKELTEIEKSKLAQRLKNQEFERVFIAMSAFHPKIAVASLKNLIGSLKDPGAINLANGGISKLAGIAIAEAIKEARETGDVSYARAIASMLNSGWSHGAHASGDEHVQGDFNVPVVHDEGGHSHTTFQEVVVEDANTREALAVSYVPVTTHNEGEHNDAHQESSQIMDVVAGASNSGEKDARRASGEWQERQDAISKLDERISYMDENLHPSNPTEKSQTESQQRSAEVTRSWLA